MATDSGGNAQIDFVWGNLPMQPNYDFDEMVTYRRGYSYRPGDGEGEYYTEGHATVSDWNDPSYFPADYLFPSQFLDGKGNHPIALRKWSGYPGNDANQSFELTVDWWEVTPAMIYPNINGLTLESALQTYRNLGIAENFLGDFLTNNSENPYNYGEGNDNGWLKNSGVVIWKYLAPDTVIGQHWDGSDWLASEADGLVIETQQWSGNWVPVGSYEDDGGTTTSDPTNPYLRHPYWLDFVVLQTTDPNKNSWNWWN